MKAILRDNECKLAELEEIQTQQTAHSQILERRMNNIANTLRDKFEEVAECNNALNCNLEYVMGKLRDESEEKYGRIGKLEKEMEGARNEVRPDATEGAEEINE